MPWDPQRYELFKSERNAPAVDLLSLLKVRPGLAVLDLGSGTGEITRWLADALPNSTTLGVDSSAEMLERSGRFAGPYLRFERRSIEALLADDDQERCWDVVFSNAALQWLPDHAALLPRLFGLLAPAGQLLVQVPSNHEHFTHRVLRELAGSEPFKTALGTWTRSSPVLDIVEYAERLHALGAADIVVLEKVYVHLMPNADALAAWMSGTALVPYEERLNVTARARFFEAYRERLRAEYPASPVFFGFRRIMLSACRPET